MKNSHNTSRKYNRIQYNSDQSNDICIVCEQSYETKKMFLCHSCKFRKCQECAVKEDNFTSEVLERSKYICTSCIEYQKPR